jgi:hypothetical protein
MTAQHTPGPWHIGREADHSSDRFKRNAEWALIRADDRDNGLIAHVESVHPKGQRKSSDFDTEAANARLIAAAPDLLQALQGALPWMAKAVESGVFSGCAMPSVAQRAYDAMNAALAKATGGN